MRSLRLFFVAAAVSLLGSATAARAQLAIDSETFRPALDGYGLFMIERAETSPKWDFGFKLFIDYAHAPLRLAMKTSAMDASPSVKTVTEHQEVVHVGAHFGFTDWLEFALDLPMSVQGYAAIYGTEIQADKLGDSLMPTGFYASRPRTNIPPPTASPLDPRIALKARTRRIGPLGLALIVAATVPFGDSSAFLGEGGFTLRPSAVVDLALAGGRIGLVLNAGAIVRGLDRRFADQTTVLDPIDVVGKAASPTHLISVGHELTAGLGMAVQALPWLGFAAEANALIPLTSESGPGVAATRDYVLDVLAGARFMPGRDITISVGGGAGVLESRRHDLFRVFAGIGWTPSDRGHAVAGASGDRDRDGIPDNLDLCPNEPEDRDGFEDEDGCPDPDNDADGIPDTSDKCPNQAEDKDGFEDEDGCPDPDNDKDGVPDVTDRCPDQAEDKDGFDDEDGCPEPDNDGDGIPDERDRCPNEPETWNGIDDEDGCPDSGGVMAAKNPNVAPSAGGDANEIREAVPFDRMHAKLGGGAGPIIDRVARQLNEGLAGRRVKVQGHADSDETVRWSNLGMGRAEAVKNELVKRGVDAARIDIVDLGTSRPIAPNKTPAGRAKNRRVDFSIVEP